MYIHLLLVSLTFRFSSENTILQIPCSCGLYFKYPKFLLTCLRFESCSPFVFPTVQNWRCFVSWRISACFALHYMPAEFLRVVGFTPQKNLNRRTKSLNLTEFRRDAQWRRCWMFLFQKSFLIPEALLNCQCQVSIRLGYHKGIVSRFRVPSDF